MDNTARTYDRRSAVEYARAWALSRNPRYYNFEKLGGDCTNFSSQCVFAGSGVMNRSPNVGWYYISAAERSPAWSGVQFLYGFLTQNRGAGPFGREVTISEAQPGDLVQLGDGEHFYHCPFIVETQPEILVCAHSFDALDRPLGSYAFTNLRFVHIDGVRDR